MHLACNERSFRAEESVQRIRDYLDHQGFLYQLSECGDNYKTVFCDIEDSLGRGARGIGKGFGFQSIASALAEAIEHFYYEFDSSPVVMRKVDRENSAEWYYLGSPNFSQILQDNSITLGHHIFQRINSSETINYPAFLSNPSYQPQTDEERHYIEHYALIRYSCNSGTACGLTTWEADLHALLELIERDAIGLFVIDTVISKHPLSVKIINTKTLPKKISKYIKEFEKELGAEIEIYDITTDLNIPSFLTSLTLVDGSRYFGSGSSLFAEYAVERSIVEAVQCVHAQEVLNFKKPTKPRDGLIDDLPKYARCLMERGVFAPFGGYEEIMYKTTNNFLKHKGDPETQLQILTNILGEKEINTYRRNVLMDSSGNPICVSQVVAPKLERFYLVTGGLHVLPSRRGQDRLDYLSLKASQDKKDNKKIQRTV